MTCPCERRRLDLDLHTGDCWQPQELVRGPEQAFLTASEGANPTDTLVPEQGTFWLHHVAHRILVP